MGESRLSSLRIHIRGSFVWLISLLLVFSMFAPTVAAIEFEDVEQRGQSEEQVQEELLTIDNENGSEDGKTLEKAITGEVEDDNGQSEESTFIVPLQVIGKSGEILVDDSIELAEKQTVLEALKRVLEAQEIAYELETANWGTYIKSINGESEGSFGGWDGWMFSVNGEEPNVGADAYEPQKGDTIQFYYGSWAVISSDSEIQEGEMDPTVTVSMVGDKFSSDVTNKENWAIQANAIGLEIRSITKESEQQVTISFNGNMQAGNLLSQG